MEKSYTPYLKKRRKKSKRVTAKPNGLTDRGPELSINSKKVNDNHKYLKLFLHIYLCAKLFEVVFHWSKAVFKS